MAPPKKQPSRPDTNLSNYHRTGHKENGDGGMEINADIPVLGKLAAKGVRVSDLIALLTLLGVAAMVFFSWQIVKTIDLHEVGTHGSNVEMTNSIKEATKQQKKLTCLLSVSQDKREKEYMNPNSFCNQISLM